MAEGLPTLAVLGGTGREGRALAARWLRVGYRVVLGSRDAVRAQATAAALNELAGAGAGVASGADLQAAAAAGDIVILTVPHAAQLTTLASVRDPLRGKILVDVTVPLVPPKVSRVQLPAAGSAAVEAQRLLGIETRVVSAFQNVSHERLQDLDALVDCHVLVCGDDADARAAVVQLAAAAGMRAWHAGPLVNAVAAEAMTSLLIFMNGHYKVRGAGIQVVGLPTP